MLQELGNIFYRAPKQVLIDLYNSFNTDKGGLSARKLSACIVIYTAMKVTVQHTNADNLESVLWVLLGFALLALGLVTIDKLVQLRTGSQPPKNETPTAP